MHLLLKRATNWPCE